MKDHIIETFDLTRVFERMPLARGFSSWARSIKKALGSVETKTITAVDNINIKVKDGEIFGLVGPNGAGKTTLIKLLCCLISPTSGTATVNGYDINKKEAQIKRSVSFVAASGWLAFDWAFTVRQNLKLFAALKGIPEQKARERIDEALKIVGLEDKANVVPSFLSSGMRQRASLAAGLIVTTPIFFLDEPTVGIDPITSHEIRDFIKKKLNKERGQTIFLTTHFMDEAEIMCDRVAIMNHGRIVACDRPDNLIEKIQTEEVIEIAALNTTPEIVTILKEMDIVRHVATHVEDPVLGKLLFRFHVRRASESLPEIVHQIEKVNGEICYAKQVKPTLEDAFVQLTQEEKCDVARSS